MIILVSTCNVNLYRCLDFQFVTSQYNFINIFYVYFGVMFGTNTYLTKKCAKFSEFQSTKEIWLITIIPWCETYTYITFSQLY